MSNIFPFDLNYRFLTHAHSHVAMLGWIYLMIFGFFVYYFVPNKKSLHKRLFWITQVSVWGMMVSFPIQGYGIVSISFSTLHILCSYYFSFIIWKNLANAKPHITLFLRTSIVFMLISTLGVWLLGPAIGWYGKLSDFYQIAIQFFLHFQFNGWFHFASLGLLFYLMNISRSIKFQLLFGFMLLSTILTFSFPLSWYFSHDSLYWMNVTGILLSVPALFIFYIILFQKFLANSYPRSSTEIRLIQFSVLCYAIKVLFQLGSLSPEWGDAIVSNRSLVIGFIHLLMLGMLSSLLIAFLLQFTYIKPSLRLNLGTVCFLVGIVSSETLLLIQGYRYFLNLSPLPNFEIFISLASLLIPLGIMFYILHFKNNYQVA